MALAFDAVSTASMSSGGGSMNHSGGSPRAVLVFLTALTTGVSADVISGVTYGGVALSEVAGSPISKTAGEDSIVHAFFLGSGIPTGTQLVAITGSSGQTMRVTCLTYAAAADCEIQAVNTEVNTDSAEDPSAVLELGGITCAVAIGLMSGQGNVANVTPFTDWTSRSEASSGFHVGGCYSYDIIGSTDVTVGWTQTADDAMAIAVAIREVEQPVPIAAGDIELRYSTTGGSAGDSEPGTPAGSLGKYVSTSVLPGGVLQNLFAHITPSSDETTVEYRCLFYANTSEEDDWAAPKVWLPSQLSGGSTLAIGLDPAGAVDSDSASAQAEEIADGVTAPDGVTFSTPTDISNALEMDTLGPGQCAALWLRRTTPAQADALAADNAVLSARGVATVI